MALFMHIATGMECLGLWYKDGKAYDGGNGEKRETMGDFIFHKTEVITYLGNPNSSLKPLGYGRASGLCGRL